MAYHDNKYSLLTSCDPRGWTQLWPVCWLASNGTHQMEKTCHIWYMWTMNIFYQVKRWQWWMSILVAIEWPFEGQWQKWHHLELKMPVNGRPLLTRPLWYIATCLQMQREPWDLICQPHNHGIIDVAWCIHEFGLFDRIRLDEFIFWYEVTISLWPCPYCWAYLLRDWCGKS